MNPTKSTGLNSLKVAVVLIVVILASAVVAYLMYSDHKEVQATKVATEKTIKEWAAFKKQNNCKLLGYADGDFLVRAKVGYECNNLQYWKLKAMDDMALKQR